MSRRGRPSRVPQWLPRMHRWLGLGSLVFILLLSCTGIALNHSSDLQLEQRFIGANWLLHWYGIDAPPPSASFAAAGHTLTLIGERLYFDDRELAENIDGLVGAVAVGEHIAVATPTRVLMTTYDGRLIEQIDARAMLPGEVIELGRLGADIIYRSEAGLYRSDEDALRIAPRAEPSAKAIEWSHAVTATSEQLAGLERLYRGRGLSVQRLLLDVHSGRAFARLGPWLMDVVGVTLVAISLFGLLLWWRRKHDSQRPSR